MKKTRTTSKNAFEKAATSGLSPREWDFRQAVLPEEELLACTLYEYARQAVKTSEQLQALLTQLAAAYAAKRGTAKRAYQFSIHSALLDILDGPLGSPLLRPDMDSAPWRELPAIERQRGKKLVRANIPHGAAHFSSTFSFGEIGEGEQSLFEYAASVHTTALVLRGNAADVECGMFSVDWNFPRDKIEQKFALWLDAQLSDRPGQVAAFSQRGKGKADSPRAWLKALGAKRLLETMTATEASDYTSECSGMSLYVDKAEWSKAKREAAARLFLIFPSLKS